MEVIVGMDNQGRIYIPKKIREKLKSKKYILKERNREIILVPLSIEERIEKYRGIIKVKRHLTIDEIENKLLEESKKIVEKEL